MKLRIFFLLVNWFSFSAAFAQHLPKEVTITDARSFSVRFSDEEGSQEVSLKCTYISKDKDYILILEGTDTLTLTDPLNYGIFREAFTLKANKKFGGTNTYSEYSLNEIFLWLYTFKHEDGQLDIAKLYVKKWAKVFTNSSDSLDEKTEQREQLLAIASDSIYSNSVKLESLKQQLNESRKAIIVERKNLSHTVVSVPDIRYDTLRLNRVYNRILTNKYTNYNAISGEIEKVKGRNDENAWIKSRLDNLNENIEDLIEVKAQQNKLKSKTNKLSFYPIRMVSIQFERGFLERVQVWIEDSVGVVDIYENIFAIGTSATINLKHYHSTRLFVRKNKGDNRYVYLSDVLGPYNNFLDLYTRDYSPADTVINFVDPNITPVLTLRKEVNIRLLDSKIYSDLNGVSQTSPNGLVQVELSRRFNIYTLRKQLGPSRANWGAFNSLKLFGALSKIEDKAKHLPLRNVNTTVNNTTISPSYVSNLDLRRYENFSLGMNLNVLLLDHPDSKLTYYLDFEARYGHVPIVDSTRRTANGALMADSLHYLDGHTVTFGLPKLSAEVFSERRIGFTLSYQFNYTMLMSNNRFKQVMSYEKSDLIEPIIEKFARKSHMFELYVRAETSREGNGQLFFRTRFFWQHGDVNTFFPQIQVGYAYNIIYRK